MRCATILQYVPLLEQCNTVLGSTPVPVLLNAKSSTHLPPRPFGSTFCTVDHPGAISHLVDVCLAAFCSKQKASS